MLQVDVDAFAKWLGKNYVPPYKYEEIDCIRWPIDEEQQADIWKKKIMEFANDSIDDKWISVKDRLPEEHESIFHKLLGTPKWSNAMWKQESKKVIVYVSFPDGTGVVTTGCLHNSDWVTTVSNVLPQTVTHWMPLPDSPK